MKQKIGSFFGYVEFLLEWLWKKHRVVVWMLIVSGIVADVVTAIKDVVTSDWFDLGLTCLALLALSVVTVLGFRWARNQQGLENQGSDA